jgi:hypothetical protein
MKIIQAVKVGNQNWKYFQEKAILKNPLVLVLETDFFWKRGNYKKHPSRVPL